MNDASIFRPSILRPLADVLDGLEANDIGTTDKGSLDWGKRDSLLDIWSTAQAIEANTYTLERPHGSVNPWRAAVDSLKREYDRTPRKVGTEVDPMEGARHHVISAPSHKYPSARKVIGRGVAPVQGSIAAPDPDDIRAAMASHLLGYVRNLRIGLNSLNVAQITDAIYGDVLPTIDLGLRRDGSERHGVMAGTDFRTYQQVFDPSHPACMEPVASYAGTGYVLSYSTDDQGRWVATLSPGEPTPTVLPRSGVEYEHAQECGPIYGPRVPRVIWQAHATCSHTDDVRRALTFRASPLARVRLRKSEQVHATQRRILCVMRQDGATTDLSTTRTPLIAPSDREGYVFIGHKLYRRGKVTRKNSARDDRRPVRRAVVARTLPDVTVESRQGWDVLVGELAPGDAFRARVNGTYVLSLTRSPYAGKFNLRLMADAPVGKSGHVALNLQVRSAATVARRLHAAVT